jgi:hypothetical protein
MKKHGLIFFFIELISFHVFLLNLFLSMKHTFKDFFKLKLISIQVNQLDEHDKVDL